MKTVVFKYGDEEVAIKLPERAQPLYGTEPPASVGKEKFVSGLDQLIGNQASKGPIAIIVADKTRLCGYPQVLPWVMETLKKRSINDDQVTFYIAYGTHLPQSEDECLAAYGEVYQKYRFIHHDCTQQDAFVMLGATRQGTQVKVRRDVVESEFILTLGAVSHHYFAGYGGGRKLLFPGLGEKKAIYTNHGLFLDKENARLAQGCWPGNLDGNPLAEDLQEIHEMLPNYRSIHAVLDSKGKPASYHFGKNYDDFLVVCRMLDDCYKIEVEKPFDLLFASAGGFPKDINMIQTHKSLHNAANLVRDGGKLVMFAECRDGIGSTTFLPYFEMGGWDNAFKALADNYTGNGGTALSMMEKTNRINIALVTSLPGDICAKLHVKKQTLEQAACSFNGVTGRIGVVQNSSLLVSDRMSTVS